MLLRNKKNNKTSETALVFLICGQKIELNIVEIEKIKKKIE